MLILRMVWWIEASILFSPQPCKALYMTTRTLRGGRAGAIGGGYVYIHVLLHRSGKWYC